jgi:hypothetical protein
MSPYFTLFNNFVLIVDFNYQIKLVNIKEYKSSVCEETWKVFQEMANEFKEKKLRVSFFNSTPQGGGGKLDGSIITRQKALP